jgi:hypothetical protein
VERLEPIDPDRSVPRIAPVVLTPIEREQERQRRERERERRRKAQPKPQEPPREGSSGIDIRV